ncbi:DNA helicase [Tanacetum coccineum]
MDQVNSWKWVLEKCELDEIDPFEFMSVMKVNNVGFVRDSLNENFVLKKLLIAIPVKKPDVFEIKEPAIRQAGPIHHRSQYLHHQYTKTLVLREVLCMWQKAHRRTTAPKMQRPWTINNKSIQVIVNDGTTTTPITCFSDQTNTLTRDVNEVLAELAYKDPYTLPPSLKQLEGTTHTFQFHFDTMVTARRPDLVLDKVFPNPTLALPPPVLAETSSPQTAAEIQHTPPETEIKTKTHENPQDYEQKKLEPITSP